MNWPAPEARRRLRLPALTALLVGLPTFWAFSEQLGFWRGVAIVSGWLGCGLLLASLLLMIREARLAAWLGGLDLMYRWHHRLGVFAYLALLVHPLALALNARRDSAEQAWAAISPSQQDWPGWLGWASLLCLMAGLGAALSARIGYRVWRQLHGLLALAVAFGTAHLLLLGLDGWLLWMPLLMIAFMMWRIVRADFGLAARPYLVSEVRKLDGSSVEIMLRPLSHSIADARPGQFIQAAFFNGPRFRGCGEFHPFTISEMTHAGIISLGIKGLGDCTRHLQEVEDGVEVRVQGPFGTFLAQGRERPNLWIAGGIGITPFIAALRGERMALPVHLVYLHRNEADAAYAATLQSLAREQPRLTMDIVVTGDALPDIAAILRKVDRLHDRECHLCGPAGLVESAVATLKVRGVAAGNIHFETFEFR